LGTLQLRVHGASGPLIISGLGPGLSAAGVLGVFGQQADQEQCEEIQTHGDAEHEFGIG